MFKSPLSVCVQFNKAKQLASLNWRRGRDLASTHLGFRLDGLATASPCRLMSESATYGSGVQIPPFCLCPVQQSQAVGFIELAEREGFGLDSSRLPPRWSGHRLAMSPHVRVGDIWLRRSNPPFLSVSSSTKPSSWLH